MSDFKAKMHQIRFPLELHPRPRWRSLQRFFRPIAVVRGSTSKRGKEKKTEGLEGREGVEKGREEVERGDVKKTG